MLKLNKVQATMNLILIFLNDSEEFYFIIFLGKKNGEYDVPNADLDSSFFLKLLDVMDVIEDEN